MQNKIVVKQYPAPPFDEGEALRYAGYLGAVDGETQSRLRDCFSESERAFSYAVCYTVCTRAELLVALGKESERWLSSRLCGVEKTVVFCATVGMGIDRLIRRYASVSPTKSLFFQAIGTERVESLCDAFCADLQTRYKEGVGTRFSVGYGEIPLSAQKGVFSLLDGGKWIGVSLNDALLMTPSKTVTAFLPVGGKRTPSNCQNCDKKDCAMRKG